MIAPTGKSNVNGYARTQTRPVVHLRLLGGYEVAVDGITISRPPTAKARSMLAYLALRRDESIRRETLMDEFWPQADATSARNNLKTTLSTIRKTFRDAGVAPDSILQITRDCVRWIAPATVDSRDFERCSIDVDEERRAAISIYTGEFSPGDTSEWAEDVRRRLSIRFEKTLRKELATVPTPELAEQLLALDPYSDEAYTVLIEDALCSGDDRTGQAIYRRYLAALGEIGTEPPPDLATRVGLRSETPARRTTLHFFGRSDELAEIARLFERGARVIVLSGISGIGKTALAQQALQHDAEGSVTVHDTDASDFDDRCARLSETLRSQSRAIVCAAPQLAQKIRTALDGAEEIHVGPLAYEEVALALRGAMPDLAGDAIQAIWKRSGGYPPALQAIASAIGAGASSNDAIERFRLERDREARIEAELVRAGSDAVDVATLCAVEPRLGDDDLAALLDWRLTRVLDARARLGEFGAAQPFFLEAALRMLSPKRRQETIHGIADRLKVHEDPNAKVHLARHLLELERPLDAARAYFEAATGFFATSSSSNAANAVDAGIEALEPIARTADATELLRQLHLLRGRALYQQGSFIPAVHALEVVMDLSDPVTDADIRTRALETMGHALVRADLLKPALSVARQAAEESSRAGEVRGELGAQHLMARVLRDQLFYDEAVEAASTGYDRSMQTREWRMAARFANIVIDISRRLLRLDTCLQWTQRQLEAAILDGPLIEAEARHMRGSIHTVIHRLDDALAEFRHALPLIEHSIRRRTVSATPHGQLEWMLHHALAHTYIAASDFERAIAESEWLVRSPWMLNSAFSAWQAVSVCVDARLGAGSQRDVIAAKMLVDQIPPASSDDPRACIDTLARARVAASVGSDRALRLLHETFAQLSACAPFHADQIHPYFYRLAASARGIDDVLAMRATETGRSYEQRVIEAAGPLWG